MFSYLLVETLTANLMKSNANPKSPEYFYQRKPKECFGENHPSVHSHTARGRESEIDCGNRTIQRAERRAKQESRSVKANGDALAL